MKSIERAAERLIEAGGEAKKAETPIASPAVEQLLETECAPSTAVQRPECELDFKTLAARGYLTPETKAGVQSEEYRHIKRPVLLNAFGKGAAPIERGNLIMVTSALPEEGKTYTAFNLAMSIAMERDTTVLLVDGDVVKPSLTELVGLTARKGLIDFLDEADLGLADIIVRTNVAGLRVLPAGQVKQNSTELLASSQMEDAVAELAERYADRVVVFDSPPMMATSQSQILARLVGQILIVVAEGCTPPQAVLDTVAEIDEDKAVGFVLNKSKRALRNYYYGGYYGGAQ